MYVSSEEQTVDQDLAGLGKHISFGEDVEGSLMSPSQMRSGSLSVTSVTTIQASDCVANFCIDSREKW